MKQCKALLFCALILLPIFLVCKEKMDLAITKTYVSQLEKLKPNTSKNVTLTIEPNVLQIVNHKGEQVVFEPREFKVYIDDSSPMERSFDFGSPKMRNESITLN